MPDTDLETQIERAIAKAMEPYARQIEDIKQDGLRSARFAGEDRERLASQVQGDTEKYASDVAEKTIKRLMTTLGVDPDKPTAFVQDMLFLKELRETFGTAKRHAMTVLIGVVMLGIASGLWQAFKMNVGKP